MNLIEIKVPQENVNDTEAKLLRWLVANGATVRAGEAIAEMETTKAAFELFATEAGVISLLAAAGVDIPIGKVIAMISSDNPAAPSLTMPPTQKPAPPPPPTPPAPREPAIQKLPAKAANPDPAEKGTPALFSRQAEEALAAHGLSREAFSGMGHVTRRDVLALAGHAAAAEQTAELIPVLLYGGGGHVKQCIEILRSMPRHKIVGIIDPGLQIGDSVLGVPVVANGDDALAKYRAEGVAWAVNAIGSVNKHRSRIKFHRRLKDAGFNLLNLIHPSALIGPDVVLGEGNQIMAGVILGPAVRIGDGCIVNSGAIVSHDSVLHDNVHVAPGAVLAGSVTVRENTLIGMGATIYIQVTVGRNAVVPNGRDVFQNVADNPD